MSKISGIRGMLLEEAILFLLNESGYTTVDERTDSSGLIKAGHSGLELYGRGGKHQIDAIADFQLTPPFSYPMRLLLEAKCYIDRYPIGIYTVRNAVGVISDVNEAWFPMSDGILKKRYHYYYTIFSASGFSEDAEKYAYAHDIFLLNLKHSHFTRQLIAKIENVSFTDFGANDAQNIDIVQKELRYYIRTALQRETETNSPFFQIRSIREFISACQQIRYSYIAMLGKRFPVFLTPCEGFSPDMLQNNMTIHLLWNDSGWYITTTNNDLLFSFDLPKTLFDAYAKSGILHDVDALDMKQQHISVIEVFARNQETRNLEIVALQLDKNWVKVLSRKYSHN